MAIAFRSFATGTESIASRDVTVDAPIGLQDDDIIIVGLLTRDLATIAIPAGWTQIGATLDISTDSSMVLLYRIAASEGSSWTWANFWDTAEQFSWASLAYSGIDTSTSLDVAATSNASGFTDTISTTSLTPITNECMIIGFHGADTASAPTGTPIGTPLGTERVEFTARPAIYVQDYLQSTAQAVTLSALMSASDFWGSFGIALRPTAIVIANVPQKMNSYRRRRAS